MNKNTDKNIKIRKYPGASLTNILDLIKPILRKEPYQILIHAGTNDHNYFNKGKKIVELVRETFKDTKLCFSLLICRTVLKDIDENLKYVSLGYLNIISIRNRFPSIPHLIDNNLDVFTIGETKQS